MHRAAASLLVAASVLLNGCGDNAPSLPPPSQNAEKLTRFDFEIDGMRYSIALPELAAMFPQHDPKNVRFAARRHQRAQKDLSFSSQPLHSDQNYDEAHVKRDAADKRRADQRGRAVVYRDLGQTGEGSGGTIKEIAGRIDLGGKTLFFVCSDQGEMIVQAGWCLDYLDNLELSKDAL